MYLLTCINQQCVFVYNGEMIEINTLKGEGFQGEFYKLHFQKQGFLIFPRPDLNNLVHFSRSQQRELGRIGVRFNLTSLLKYPHFFREINFILVTDSQEALLLPFLARLLPEATIIATSLSYQLARISLQAFQERLSDFDTTSQDIDFFKESEILDQYEEKMKVSFEDWRTLFSKQEITNLLSKMVKVNQYQVYDTERGIRLRSFPSGKNNGACLWQLEAVLTEQKILLVNEISLFNWRTCQPCNLSRVKQSHKQSPYHLILFTRIALDSYAESEEARLAQTIRRVNSNANIGISTSIVLEDVMLCIDLIPRLSVQPEGKIRHIFVGHQSMHYLHNYVNSYADYLSQHYKDQLFSDSPDYPLIHYTKLKQRGILLVGTLQELAIKKKLPLKEVVLQSHPFVRFVKDYEHYLQIENEDLIEGNVKHCFQKISLASNFGSTQLEEFIGGVGKARVVCFSQTSLPVERLQLSRKYELSLGAKLPLHLMSNNFKGRQFQAFRLVSNQLELEERRIELIKIPKNWAQMVANQLSSKGIRVEEQKKSSVRTENCEIEERGGEVRVRGRSGEEMMAIGRCLEGLGKEWER